MKRHTFCLFCKSKKIVYNKKHAGFTNWILSSFCAVIASFALFQDLDLRSVVFLGVFIAIAEIFIHLRWRMSIICNECGFDPVIYMKDQQSAASIVQRKLKNRAKNPANYLKPALNMPVKIVSPMKTEKIISMGSLSPKQRQLLSLNATKKRQSEEQETKEAKQSQSIALSNMR